MTHQPRLEMATAIGVGYVTCGYFIYFASAVSTIGSGICLGWNTVV
jgi:hypothetical protein